MNTLKHFIDRLFDVMEHIRPQILLAMALIAGVSVAGIAVGWRMNSETIISSALGGVPLIALLGMKVLEKND